jgi:error-prone DNA polymerase
MAAWRRRGGLERYRERLVGGMVARGYGEGFAQQIYQQILGFGEYGFPESHAASFALLVYVSAWLKHHHPAAFFAALLDSQPMGFYAPAQLVREARRQGVEVRPVDVRHSGWDCTLEGPAGRADAGAGVTPAAVPRAPAALRLGLRLIKGLSRDGAERLVRARADRAFVSVSDLAWRAGLDRRDLKALAAADALRGLAGNRHRAAWQVAGVEPPLPLFGVTDPGAAAANAVPLLPVPTEGGSIAADYAALGLSLRRHPLALLRERLRRLGLASAREVQEREGGAWVRAGGLVINRQRPASANSVTFVTLEDETGHLNLVVWKRLAERRRRVLLGARLLGVAGEVQRESGVVHLIAKHLWDHSDLLGGLLVRARDFR